VSLQDKDIPTDTAIVSGQDFLVDSTLKVPQLDFKNADIRDVFNALAKAYNLNLWLDESVQGKVTLHLVNTSLNRVLEFILQQNNLVYEKSDNIIKISKAPAPPPEPLKIAIIDSFLSVDLKDADLSEVVRILVQQGRENIVVESGIAGRVSGTLKDIEFEKGLKALMMSNGFLVRKIEGVWHIDRLPTEQQVPRYKGVYSVAYKDKRLSIDVANANLSDLIREIANLCNLNIFTYGALEGQVSAKCVNLTVDEALSYLLKTSNYTFRKQDQVYFVGNKDLEGMLVAELIQPQHLVAEGLLDALPQNLTTKATLKVIKEQNGIMVQGPYNVVQGIKEFIDEMDLPPAQILIEALVVDYSKTAFYDYGIVANSFGLSDSLNRLEHYYPNIQLFSSGKNINEKWFPRLGIKNVGKLPDNFFIQLKAMEQAGKANVRSRPQLATLNGQKAKIDIGTTQYYLLKTETIYASGQPTVSTQVSEKFQTIEAAMSLTITPNVTPQGDIIVEIHPEFNTPQGAFDPKVPPTINHRILDSKVRLRDGETIVLGGLIQTIEDETVHKFPLLGDIPLLKYLFSNRSKTKTEAELVIYLTPYVYYGSEGAVDISKYKEK